MRTVFWDINLTLVTSSMTLGEVQVKPLSKGALEEAKRFRDTIAQVATIISFDMKTADAYARIRSTTTVRGADAIQLACAAAADVDLFVTNDKALLKLPSIEGIGFITPMDRVPF
jgi:predicted nucleic acid-binding protein